MPELDNFAEINLSAIKKNIKNLKKLAGEKTKLMAVIKADAYGHGAVHVGKTAIESGAYSLAVARSHEALELRESGIKSQILNLGYPLDENLDYLTSENIDISVYDYESALAISKKARDNGRTPNIHIKVDTGMGRLGITGTYDEIVREVKKIISLENLNPIGLFTHFSTADEKSREYTDVQLAKFNQIIKGLNQNKIYFRQYHCANTAALINYKHSRKDIVRTGIGIYGLYPSENIDRSKICLHPAMTLKAKIIQIKTVKKDFNVSYGNTWKTQKDSRLAIIAIGYADGFPRRISSSSYFLINGQKAWIRGRICMDLCVVDITDIEGVKPGDYATIIGKSKDQYISADLHAENADTINYEIVSSLTSRVKRIYIN